MPLTAMDVFKKLPTPEGALLSRVSESGRFVRSRIRQELLAKLADNVTVRNIGQGSVPNYLEGISGNAYAELRFELYADEDLLWLMVQGQELQGMPVPLKLGGIAAASTLWGRCDILDGAYSPYRVIVCPEVAAAGVFVPQPLTAYSADDGAQGESGISYNAVDYSNLGWLYSGQLWGEVPGTLPHMLLCQVRSVPFTPEFVQAVTLPKDGSLFLGKLIERQGIDIFWV